MPLEGGVWDGAVGAGAAEPPGVFVAAGAAGVAGAAEVLPGVKGVGVAEPGAFFLAALEPFVFSPFASAASAVLALVAFPLVAFDVLAFVASCSLASLLFALLPGFALLSADLVALVFSSFCVCAPHAGSPTRARTSAASVAR